MKVFIVDDSVILRDRLKSMLSELREVEITGEAENAQEAVKEIRKIKPDVVILDIRMPRGNGIEVLKSIKCETPAPIVIMLTNYPYPQYRTKCIELGADYFFDKSAEFDSIMEVLEQLIRGSNQSRN